MLIIKFSTDNKDLLFIFQLLDSNLSESNIYYQRYFQTNKKLGIAFEFRNNLLLGGDILWTNSYRFYWVGFGNIFKTDIYLTLYTYIKIFILKFTFQNMNKLEDSFNCCYQFKPLYNMTYMTLFSPSDSLKLSLTIKQHKTTTNHFIFVFF